MTDDKTKTDFRDRDRVAGDQEYDARAIRYFAEKFGLHIGQVRARQQTAAGLLRPPL